MTKITTTIKGIDMSTAFNDASLSQPIEGKVDLGRAFDGVVKHFSPADPSASPVSNEVKDVFAKLQEMGDSPYLPDHLRKPLVSLASNDNEQRVQKLIAALQSMPLTGVSSREAKEIISALKKNIHHPDVLLTLFGANGYASDLKPAVILPLLAIMYNESAFVPGIPCAQKDSTATGLLQINNPTAQTLASSSWVKAYKGLLDGVASKMKYLFPSVAAQVAAGSLAKSLQNAEPGQETPLNLLQWQRMLKAVDRFALWNGKSWVPKATVTRPDVLKWWDSNSAIMSHYIAGLASIAHLASADGEGIFFMTHTKSGKPINFVHGAVASKTGKRVLALEKDFPTISNLIKTAYEAFH